MANLDPLRLRIRKRINTAVTQAAPKLQKALKESALKDTGAMAQMTTVSGLKTTSVGPAVEVRVAVPYATFTVPPGTPPHVIRPVRAKALSFFWPVAGKVVFFQKVNHPGFAGSPWYDDVVKTWPEMVESELPNR